MDFLTSNIDRAIVMTQYDLRGFAHPLGWREDPMSSPKSLDAITGNFMGFAAGLGGGNKKPTDKRFADYFGSTYRQYLAMCRRLHADCDESQKEAIRLIVEEIFKQSEQMKAVVKDGKMEPTTYLKPLAKDNRWGKAMLALAKVFDAKFELPSAT